MPYRSRPTLPALVVAALLAGGAVATATSCQAASVPLKPGLWDYSLQTQRGDGPPMNLSQMLASLPPSARPQVEARLRAQGMALGPDGALRICLDAASLAGGHPPLHLAGRCQEQWSLASPGHWSFHYACTAPSVDGHGKLRISSPTAYQSHYTVKGPQGSVSGDAQAHWVGASCGDVPPLRATR